MDLASLYIILGSISFITSVVTLGVLIKKFIEQPAAHGFFVYSDTIASALLSLGLLLDGVKQSKHIKLASASDSMGLSTITTNCYADTSPPYREVQVISLKPSLADENCYQFKLLYGLFVVAIITGFFSVLGALPLIFNWKTNLP